MGSAESLTADQRRWLAAVRDAESLEALRAHTDATSDHDAYLEAKERWWDLRVRELDGEQPTDGPPGACVELPGQPIYVHGITHADTDAERTYLRERVADLLGAGARVYCEQGIRSMYFEDVTAACGMDDYRWAMDQCQQLDVDTHLHVDAEAGFEGLLEDVQDVTAQFQDAVFEVLDDGSDDGLRASLGDVASAFLTSHADLSTGDDFESFQRTRAAAEDPSQLPALQRYYERRFLPQPLEREWLRRHDRELEIVTHARNERMADYAVYHAEGHPVHLLVGAAHQPGVRYYLERHRDGDRTLAEFELPG